MMRFIISLLVILVLVPFLSGCASSKKNTTELRGLMLLENTQLGRNRSYYSRYGAKKLVNKHQKFHRKIKKKALRKR
jgi:hypothetical protein